LFFNFYYTGWRTPKKLFSWVLNGFSYIIFMSEHKEKNVTINLELTARYKTFSLAIKWFIFFFLKAPNYLLTNSIDILSYNKTVYLHIQLNIPDKSLWSTQDLLESNTTVIEYETHQLFGLCLTVFFISQLFYSINIHQTYYERWYKS
jgi:hypothetical protein